MHVDQPQGQPSTTEKSKRGQLKSDENASWVSILTCGLTGLREIKRGPRHPHRKFALSNKGKDRCIEFSE